MRCDAAQTRGPAIFGNAEPAGQTRRYFRKCKDIEAKMRKQREKSMLRQVKWDQQPSLAQQIIHD